MYVYIYIYIYIYILPPPAHAPPLEVKLLYHIMLDYIKHIYVILYGYHIVLTETY